TGETAVRGQAAVAGQASEISRENGVFTAVCVNVRWNVRRMREIPAVCSNLRRNGRRTREIPAEMIRTN
ncbi:MAG: hypothetical protein ACI4UJ_03035, partial [Candidatus Cryptobacteroides sp.]